MSAERDLALCRAVREWYTRFILEYATHYRIYPSDNDLRAIIATVDASLAAQEVDASRDAWEERMAAQSVDTWQTGRPIVAAQVSLGGGDANDTGTEGSSTSGRPRESVDVTSLGGEAQATNVTAKAGDATEAAEPPSEIPRIEVGMTPREQAEARLAAAMMGRLEEAERRGEGRQWIVDECARIAADAVARIWESTVDIHCPGCECAESVLTEPPWRAILPDAPGPEEK